jgi:hypothetical protein
MPHNLYLHSSIVQTRKYVDTHESKREAIRFATIDSSAALMFALFINAAILVMAAATFHGTGHEDVADISDAYQLLSPLLGSGAASILFAVALLCSGQNATLTGTLRGQIVMEGLHQSRVRPWLRRLVTRLLAIIPAIIVVALYGERGTGALLILSQVILSLQLSFAGVSARDVHRRQGEDGAVCGATLDAKPRLGRRGYHCGAQRLAACADSGLTCTTASSWPSSIRPPTRRSWITYSSSRRNSARSCIWSMSPMGGRRGTSISSSCASPRR